MTYETAFTLFAYMPPEQQLAVITVYRGISGAFADVRDAFSQAVADEFLVVETEMLLLQQTGAVMQ